MTLTNRRLKDWNLDVRSKINIKYYNIKNILKYPEEEELSYLIIIIISLFQKSTTMQIECQDERSCATSILSFELKHTRTYIPYSHIMR